MSDTQPIEGQEQPTAEAEPPRPRAGLFGPPGRDYECANCGGHWRVSTGRWQCPHCYYYSPARGKRQ